MHLIVIYLVAVAIGEVAAFFIGRIVEQVMPQFSMLIYMGLFFGVLWLAWPLSVMMAERLMPEGDARRTLRS
jgi:cation transporter-like permease